MLPDKPGPGEIIFSWLMLPAYAWQGIGVRRKTHRMAPPENSGAYELDGRGSPLRLLVIGDSSAAGVGVETIEQSFSGYLPRFLHEISGRPVLSRVIGLNSATSSHLRDFALPHIEPRHIDYVALNVGTNDAKNFHTSRRFCRDFGTLLYALRSRFPGAAIIWSGVLDLEKVPALPRPLNRILGIRSRLIDYCGRILCRERGALALPPEWRPVSENFSADGFHASEEGYREWAASMAGYIMRLEKQASRRSAEEYPSNVG